MWIYPYATTGSAATDVTTINYTMTYGVCDGLNVQASYGSGGTSGICWVDSQQAGIGYGCITESGQWVCLPVFYQQADTSQQKADREKRAHETEVAASRADLLLMEFLSHDQAEQYKREKKFELTINGRIYRVHKGRSGNIQLIEGGKPVARYCAHPEIWTPDGDTLIAQMLMLQTDEAQFLKIANRTALV
jgi:hypothetical protein